MKKIFRILSVVVLVMVLFLAIPQMILMYPGFLFEYKFTHRNLVVLSDRAIGTGFREILDSVSQRLSVTGFYDDTIPVTIVLPHGKLETFLMRISMAEDGAGFHHFSGTVYLFTDRIDQFRQANQEVEGELKSVLKYNYQQFEFDDLMTHEILHKLHSDTLGVLTFRRKMPPPHWKAEGFAEYYTFQNEKRASPDYDFRDRVRLYLKYKNQFSLFYYKSQLLYEFLSEHKQMTFAEIMEDELTEDVAMTELLAWFESEGNLDSKSGHYE
jgi:hypothetical protein